MDLLVPLNILTSWEKYFMVDYNTHWTMIKQVQKVNTHNVIEFLKECFSHEGIPSTVVTDNGVQFTSEEIRTFLKELDIKHDKVALYCPRANGLVERTNRMVKECIQSAIRNRVCGKKH